MRVFLASLSFWIFVSQSALAEGRSEIVNGDSIPSTRLAAPPNTCEEFFLKNPEARKFARPEMTLENVLKEIIYERAGINGFYCGKGAVESWSDQSVDIWESLKKTTLTRTTLVHACDDDKTGQCRMLWAESAPGFLDLVPRDEVKKMSTYELLNKIGQYQGKNRDLEAKQLNAEGRRLFTSDPSTLSAADKIRKEQITSQSKARAEEAAKRTAAILSAVTAKLQTIGVQLECYNNQKARELLCYGLGYIFDPITIGLPAIKIANNIRAMARLGRASEAAADAVKAEGLASAAAKTMIDDSRKALESQGYKPLAGPGRAEGWKTDGTFRAQETYRRELNIAIGLANPEAKLNDEMKWASPFRDSYFQNLVDKAAQNHGSANVADLFGSGYYTDQLKNVHSTTGMRLGPNDLKVNEEVMRRGFKPKPNDAEVHGDILNIDTWSELDRSMRRRNIKGYDLMTMKPEGGWQKLAVDWPINKQVAAIRFIVANACQRLAKDGHFYVNALVYGSEFNPKAQQLATKQLKEISDEVERAYGKRMKFELLDSGDLSIAIIPR